MSSLMGAHLSVTSGNAGTRVSKQFLRVRGEGALDFNLLKDVYFS